jgi:energy-coupling factor transporter ATP-binding protein EcfA2
MRRFSAGSEWRKWDMHVHVPGTKLSNGYKIKAGDLPEVDQFVDVLALSDVHAFGITDYYSLDAFFDVKQAFQTRHPTTEKVLFPNMELRLNESVNKDTESVNIHIIFRPDLSRQDATKFMSTLQTEIRDDKGVLRTCADLDTSKQFEAASVTRPNILRALKAVFGDKEDFTDNVLVIVSAKGDGIRKSTGGSGRARRGNLSDEIDRASDAVFGRGADVDYFNSTDRFEDPKQRSKPKPVLGGCDAHNFKDLRAWLGKAIDTPEQRKEILWVKADLTFEGLQQTVQEPIERVRIQAERPDQKPPYRYLEAIEFDEPGVFPARITLNPNLVSIIGTRSSGKSSLLAYIAHAVDPEYTIRQQIASGGMTAKTAGPAAGITWPAADTTTRKVVWGDSESKNGRVIYIPQNSLHAISGRQKEITEKISPALLRSNPDFRPAWNDAGHHLELVRTRLRTAVENWFTHSDLIHTASAAAQDLGDPESIGKLAGAFQADIDTLKGKSTLSAVDVESYQAVVRQLSALAVERETLERNLALLARWTEAGRNADTNHVNVSVSITPTPSLSSIPDDAAAELAEYFARLEMEATKNMEAVLAAHRVKTEVNLGTNERSATALNLANADLVSRNMANTELEGLVKQHKNAIDLIKNIAEKNALVAKLRADQLDVEAEIRSQIVRRAEVLEAVKRAFQSEVRSLDSLTFGLEYDVPAERKEALLAMFNRSERSTYLDESRSELLLADIQSAPELFLSALWTGKQKINRGTKPRDVATEVLTDSPEIRYTATLEDDRIGGFEESSMTPGKQALFALTLLLNESDEKWPLLIDQPEDDLDSRSIFLTIVPYLKERKRERQIIMVSHNANLVIGADSEQVIVANRHANDRPNKSSQTFDYLSGSLEHSSMSKTRFTLEGPGIREHACFVLDGGRDAFEKRKNKYHL